MNETDIRKYALLMGELGLTGLEIRDETRTVRLERACAAPAAVTTVTPLEAPPQAASGDQVESPMVGTFYRAPAEDAEPYVKAGDHVNRGDVLCIIEAMKMMNEITAEFSGTVLEVCAENGQVVDFGCPLFRIGRDGA